MQEDELLKKIDSNDPKAFEIVMNTYNRLLWVIVGGILGHVGTQEDIEECISDVYITLWEKPKAYNPEKGTLKTFLVIIAKNKALDKYRRISKVKFAQLNDAIRSSDDDLMGYIVNKEMCQQLYDAIQILKEPDKEIMVRRYFFEEKPSYIADKISLPVKEVENRLYQSKVKLKKHLMNMEVTGYGL